MRLVLASASPRRAELLAAAGFEFDVLAVDIDERRKPGEAPDAYVRRLAGDKSAAAVERLKRSAEGPAEAGPHSRGDEVVVLGADTVVVIDGDVLGKPESDAEAREMLRRLSGQRHEVLTGVSVRILSATTAEVGVEVGTVERTAVFFAPLGDEDIEWYVQTGEGRDKAGAYAIQGLASRFIPRIEGSYSNVVGLPVAAVQQLLARSMGSPVDAIPRVK